MVHKLHTDLLILVMSCLLLDFIQSVNLIYLKLSNL